MSSVAPLARRRHTFIALAIAFVGPGCLGGSSDAHLCQAADGGWYGCPFDAGPGAEGGATFTGSGRGDAASDDASDATVSGGPCSSPGATDSGACGNCGSHTRICQKSGTWSDWSACAGEGECSAGATGSQSCGSGGMQTRTCSSTCIWGEFGACSGGGDTCTSPGATDSRSCGKCGTQTRTCGSDGVYGAWGACGGETGTCTPGTTRSATCSGACGARVDTCSPSCTWSTGTCSGGTCSPGETDTSACSGGGSRTCSSSCTWGACIGGSAGGCASGAAAQTFNSGGSGFSMVGCSGTATWSAASSLCDSAGGWHLCSASEFVARMSGTSPTHNYWVSDYLNGSGTASGTCEASTSTAAGNFCPAGSPMRVCSTTSTTDGSNTCTWNLCGLESQTSDLYFGGCNDSGTAGAVCCQ